MDNTCKIAGTGLVGMLHEMNNPLTNIKLCMELLESGNEESKEVYFGIINKNVEAMEIAIKQISNSFINEGFGVHFQIEEL